MHKFLNQLTDHFLESGKNISGITFVLPNIRAGIFLKTSFKERIKGIHFIPEIISIEEFITRLSGLTKSDNLHLLFEFYKVYSHFNRKNDRETFENFAKWAFLLIQDFNDIDKNLKDASEIFNYLIDAKRIEKIFMEEESEITRNYFLFIERISDYYLLFNKNLLAKNTGYQGLQYKKAWENVDSFIKKVKQSNRYIFAGFNALNLAEEKIIQKLLESDIAEIFWDTDSFYLKPQNLTGKFIHQYQNSWKYYTNHDFLWVGSNLTKPKNIKITGAAKNVNQIKYIGEILKQSDDRLNNYHNTAIVLADEKLLPVLLNSLPEEVKQVNITMGYALKNIAFSSFFEFLFRMHINKNRNGLKDMFYFKDVSSLLNLSFLSKLIDQEKLKAEFVYFAKNNTVLIHKEDIIKIIDRISEANDFVKELFEEWNENVSDVLKSIDKLIMTLKDNDELKLLELEYLFRFKNIFNSLSHLNDNYHYISNINALYQFYEQILNQESLSFRGEPLQGLQIMGMLESRALDFDHVIITSVNEGILPEGKKQNSFIPFDIKVKFGLTTYKDKDAIFSYHFFRILQRAKQVVLTYNTEADEYGLGEQSRFITQLELAKQTGELKNLEIIRTIFNPEVPGKNLALYEIKKNDPVIKRLHEIGKKGFSPTVLTSYIRNPIDFYKQHILKIREPDTIEEQVAFNTFGTIIHKSLENLYTPFIKKILTEDDLKSIRAKIKEEVKKQFLEHFSTYSISKGKNYLSVQVAIKYILKFVDLEIDMIKKGKKIRILALEKPVKLEYKPKTLNFSINLKGYIDRIDEVDDTLRIIDYKTGKVEQKDLKIEDWENLITDYKFSKSFQILMYAYLYSKNTAFDPDQNKIESGIFSFKNLKSGFMCFNNSNIQHDELDNFIDQLDLLLKEIFDTEIPFTEKEIKTYKF